MNARRVLVRGIGDVGSAVAHTLFCAGLRVVVHDVARPAYTRRGMAFIDAMFDGKARLQDVYAKRSPEPAHLRRMLECGRAIAVTSGEVDALVSMFAPDALVDARMRKREMPEPQRHLAPVSIGLGPNFVAGETTALAVETAWGDDLGRVVHAGPTQPLAGEPREIAGHMRDRYVYAPVGGIFLTELEIGMPVVAGQVVARIGSVELAAPLAGRLRGLTHTEVQVAAGTKVIEIDPRDADADIYGIGERPRRIAQGVLAALREGGVLARQSPG